MCTNFMKLYIISTNIFNRILSMIMCNGVMQQYMKGHNIIQNSVYLCKTINIDAPNLVCVIQYVSAFAIWNYHFSTNKMIFLNFTIDI